MLPRHTSYRCTWLYDDGLYLVALFAIFSILTPPFRTHPVHNLCHLQRMRFALDDARPGDEGQRSAANGHLADLEIVRQCCCGSECLSETIPPENQKKPERKMDHSLKLKIHHDYCFDLYGLAFIDIRLVLHCFTASMAVPTSIGCPLTTANFSTVPSLPISACSTTEPWIRAWRANGG